MGEAKRRKLVGDYPLHSGRAEDFNVPDGVAGVTLDIDGTAPMTYVIEAAHLTKSVELFAASLKPHTSYQTVCRAVVSQVLKMRSGRCITPTEVVGVGAFWMALHHPKGGLRMRQAVSASLRTKGSAHITLTVGQQGLAIALSDRFADMQGLLTQAVQQDAGVFVYEAPPSPEGKPN